MNCEKIQYELSLADQGSSLPTAIHEHLKSCISCRNFASLVEKQNQEISDLTMPTPSDWEWLVRLESRNGKETVSPVSPAMVSHPRTKKERTFGKIAVAVALAAGLLVAAIGLIPWLPFSQRWNSNGGDFAVNPKPGSPPTSDSFESEIGVPKREAPNRTLETPQPKAGAPAIRQMDEKLPPPGAPPREVMLFEEKNAKSEPEKINKKTEISPSGFAQSRSEPAGIGDQKKPAKDQLTASPSIDGLANTQGYQYGSIAPLPDQADSRSILRGVVPSPEQKVRFTLLLCQQSSADVLNRAQTEMDLASKKNNETPQTEKGLGRIANSQKTDSLKPGAPQGGGGLGGRGAGVADAGGQNQKRALEQNTLPMLQNSQLNSYFAIVPNKNPEDIIKSYEDIINKDIPALLTQLKSPSNKKDLDTLLQYLKDSEKDFTQLASQVPKPANWLTRVIDLNKKGIALIQAHNP